VRSTGAIEAGDAVISVIAAANRDPSVFKRPDELRIFGATTAPSRRAGMGPDFLPRCGTRPMEALPCSRHSQTDTGP